MNLTLRHKILRLLSALICASAMWACGDSETFTIEGTVDGNATLNLRFIYLNNGTLVRGLTAARDGKFEYKGVATVPTIVDILDNDYRLLGRVYTVNGEHITCQLTRNAPNAIKVSGSGISERWASFLNANAEALSGKDANAVIERYVASNPSDLVSTLLMVTSYDASTDALRADSVMSMIDTEQRPAVLVGTFNALLQRLVAVNDTVAPISALNMRDSIVEFDPAARRWSLIVLSDDGSGRSDSIVDALRRLNRKSLRPRLQIADISLDRDTAAWHNSVRPDSASWTRLWVAGSLASPGIDRLGASRLPYFIVTDSTGRRLFSSPSVSKAEAFIDSLDNKK